jgi:hypothetical protein
MLPDVSEVNPDWHQSRANGALTLVTDETHRTVPVVNESRALGDDFVDNLTQ